MVQGLYPEALNIVSNNFIHDDPLFKITKETDNPIDDVWIEINGPTFRRQFHKRKYQKLYLSQMTKLEQSLHHRLATRANCVDTL